MNKKKLPVLITLGILLVLACIISVSYALFIVTDKQTNNNILNSSCLDFEIKNEQNEISLQNSFPLLDEEGKKLTPFTFTVKNTCNTYMSYTINLETLSGSTLANKYIKVLLNSEAIANLDTLPSSTSEYYYEGSIASKVLGTYALGPDEEEDFSLRLWLDGDATPSEETMNKVFNSKIVVRAAVSTFDPVSSGITTLHDAILANEYQTTDIELAKEKIANKQAVDTTKTAPIITWKENISSTPIENVTSATLPANSLIGSSFDVTEEETKVRLGKGYTLDSETGYYDLTDYDYYDPTAVNYGETDYYFCRGGYSINSEDKINTWSNVTQCLTIYKITSVSIDPSITTSINSMTQTEFAVTKYFFTGFKLEQVELESDKSDRGLYQAEDDFGTTYYYRGSVKNNFVYFGGFYWQIIRVNGNGSIRMMYAGVSPNSTGSQTYIKIAPFNILCGNPAYVGYMHGTVLNSSLEQTQANEVDSNAKVELEKWYKMSIVDKGLNGYIADSGFCNDRGLSPTTSGNGYTSDKTTFYAPYYRYYTTKMPTYICANAENDLFTTVNIEVGNNAATYPVGLITVDELMYAGFAHGYMNTLNYLYQNGYYWTMSPSYSGTATTTTYELIHSLYGYSADGWISSNNGLRPVINLKSDVTISGGVGTSDNPFVVETA